MTYSRGMWEIGAEKGSEYLQEVKKNILPETVEFFEKVVLCGCVGGSLCLCSAFQKGKTLPFSSFLLVHFHLFFFHLNRFQTVVSSSPLRHHQQNNYGTMPSRSTTKVSHRPSTTLSPSFIHSFTSHPPHSHHHSFLHHHHHHHHHHYHFNQPPSHHTTRHPGHFRLHWRYTQACQPLQPATDRPVQELIPPPLNKKIIITSFE